MHVFTSQQRLNFVCCLYANLGKIRRKQKAEFLSVTTYHIIINRIRKLTESKRTNSSARIYIYIIIIIYFIYLSKVILGKQRKKKGDSTKEFLSNPPKLKMHGFLILISQDKDFNIFRTSK